MSQVIIFTPRWRPRGTSIPITRGDNKWIIRCVEAQHEKKIALDCGCDADRNQDIIKLVLIAEPSSSQEDHFAWLGGLM